MSGTWYPSPEEIKNAGYEGVGHLMEAYRGKYPHDELQRDADVHMFLLFGHKVGDVAGHQQDLALPTQGTVADVGNRRMAFFKHSQKRCWERYGFRPNLMEYTEISHGIVSQVPVKSLLARRRRMETVIWRGRKFSVIFDHMDRLIVTFLKRPLESRAEERDTERPAPQGPDTTKEDNAMQETQTVPPAAPEPIPPAPIPPEPAAMAVRGPAPLNWMTMTEDKLYGLMRTRYPKASAAGMAFFLQYAKARHMDPFSNQLHLVTYDGQDQIQMGIDGWRTIAQREGDYAGQSDVVFDDQYTEFQMRTMEPHADHPVTATVIVKKVVGGLIIEVPATAGWDSYYPTNPKNQFMWKKMPYLMLGKCAEALALRKAYPEQFTNVYEPAEMDQALDASIVQGAVISASTGPQAKPVTKVKPGAIVTLPAPAPSAPPPGTAPAPAREPVARTAAVDPTAMAAPDQIVAMLKLATAKGVPLHQLKAQEGLTTMTAAAVARVLVKHGVMA